MFAELTYGFGLPWDKKGDYSKLVNDDSHEIPKTNTRAAKDSQSAATIQVFLLDTIGQMSK